MPGNLPRLRNHRRLASGTPDETLAICTGDCNGGLSHTPLRSPASLLVSKIGAGHATFEMCGHHTGETLPYAGLWEPPAAAVGKPSGLAQQAGNVPGAAGERCRVVSAGQQNGIGGAQGLANRGPINRSGGANHDIAARVHHGWPAHDLTQRVACQATA